MNNKHKLTDFVKEYCKKNIFPIPIPARSKAPKLLDWQNLRILINEIDQYFKEDMNVGALLGIEPNSLTDIDLDSEEAIQISDYYLPDTLIFGRDSTPKSHRFYLCRSIKTQKFNDIGKGGCLLEIRSKGTQTVVPPSIHPSGEKVRFFNQLEPVEIDADTLIDKVKKIAAATIIARHWPKTGNRQNTAMALAGGLLRAGFSEVETELFIKVITKSAGDEESDQRVAVVKHTAERLKNNENVNGFPEFSKNIDRGPEVLAKALNWLNIKTTVINSPITWEEPLPLPDKILPVDKITDDLIPSVFKQWLESKINMLQVPTDFVLIPALLSAGTLIGSKICIYPKVYDSWPVITNLWGGFVGKVASFKTPSINEALVPIRRLQAEFTSINKSNKLNWLAKKHTINLKLKNLEEQLKTAVKSNSDTSQIESEIAKLASEKDPTAIRLYTNDASFEKVGELMVENPNGLIVIRDELTAFLSKLDKHGFEAEKGFYLEAWEGSNPFYFDRIGRGTVELTKSTISVFGGIQPGPLSHYIFKSMSGLKNDGLLQRFSLLAHPDDINESWRINDKAPDKSLDNKIYMIFKALYKLNVEDVNAVDEFNKGIPGIRFAPDAQEVFDKWLEGQMNRLRMGKVDSEALTAHLTKYNKMVPALALIFYLIKVVDRQSNIVIGQVDLQSIEQAIRWADYMESHAKKIYSISKNMDVKTAGLILDRIKKGDLHDGFSGRRVYRNGWSGLPDSKIVYPALDLLVEYGYLQDELIRTPGRPKSIYRINPKIIVK